MWSTSLLSLAILCTFFDHFAQAYTVDLRIWPDSPDCNPCSPFWVCGNQPEGDCCRARPGMLGSSANARVNGWVENGHGIRISGKSAQSGNQCAVQLGNSFTCFSAPYAITGLLWMDIYFGRSKRDGRGTADSKTTKTRTCHTADTIGVHANGFEYSLPLGNTTHSEAVEAMYADKTTNKLRNYILQHGEASVITDSELSRRSAQC
ncbi:hypothetical protein BGZ63DRAFT_401361 [Mariannaea sp. PMI_226]|nr:hypothetical protein BGZ63DRAFT_401361 [Mariannaea sp. PMI_226]